MSNSEETKKQINYQNKPLSQKSKNERFCEASELGNLDLIKKLINKADPSFKQNYPIIIASKNGYGKLVEYLLKDFRVDPSDQNNRAIIEASNFGHLSIVEKLLLDDRVNPSDLNNYALINASCNGHLKIVELLLRDRRVDPSDQNNKAIIESSYNGHVGVVKILLNNLKVDPTDNDDKAIVNACLRNHMNIIEFFVKDKRLTALSFFRCFMVALDTDNIKLMKFLLKIPKLDPCDPDSYFEDIHGTMNLRGEPDPSYMDNLLIINASREGKYEIVELLLEDERINPSDQGDKAILEAAINGHIKIVKLLLEDRRIEYKCNGVIIFHAWKNGHIKLVKFLLKNDETYPSVEDNIILKDAFNKNNIKIIELILSHKLFKPPDDKSRSENNIFRKMFCEKCSTIELIRLIMKYRPIETIFIYEKPKKGEVVYSYNSYEIRKMITRFRMFDKIINDLFNTDYTYQEYTDLLEDMKVTYKYGHDTMLKKGKERFDLIKILTETIPVIPYDILWEITRFIHFI